MGQFFEAKCSDGTLGHAKAVGNRLDRATGPGRALELKLAAAGLEALRARITVIPLLRRKERD